MNQLEFIEVETYFIVCRYYYTGDTRYMIKASGIYFGNHISYGRRVPLFVVDVVVYVDDDD